MATVPQWLIGRLITAIAVNPQTVGAGGVLSAVGAQVLTGLLEEIQPESYNDTENIVPMDVRQDNEVIIGSGERLSLTEILSPNTGSSYNVLRQVAAGYDYFLATFTRGGDVFSCYFVIKGYSETNVRGKNSGVLTGAPCGISGTI